MLKIVWNPISGEVLDLFPGNGGTYPKTKINLFVPIIYTTSMPNFMFLAFIVSEIRIYMTDRRTDGQTDGQTDGHGYFDSTRHGDHIGTYNI